MNANPKDWIGRTLESEDAIAPERARALWASLETGEPCPEMGSALPPLWHWVYFWSIAPRSNLGPDGHAALGGFMPDLGRVRRMWAGSRLTFHQPLLVGEPAHRLTTIADVAAKTGRSGALTFITLRHDISGPRGLAVSEEQDLVYRQMPASGTASPARPAKPAPEGGARVEKWSADPVLLFRYSALTFNSHRIHYDAPYAREAEGYPGIIVHGPLIATLMAGAALRHRPGTSLSGFDFRAMSPIFAGDPFTIHLDEETDRASIRVREHNGGLAAAGGAVWSD